MIFKSLNLFILIIQTISANGKSEAWEGEPRDNNQYWQTFHNAFLNKTQTNGSSIKIVFLGDSLTNLWAHHGKNVWKENYEPLGAVNYGIGGDDTRNVIWRISNGEIDGLDNAKLVVLMIGANNIIRTHDSVQNISKGIERIIEIINAKMPSTKILLLGCLPFALSVAKNSQSVFIITANINFLIKEFDNGNSIRFLNMWTDFGQAIGTIKEDFFIKDKVHLSEAGYAKWAQLMNPLLKEMIG